MVKRFRNIGLLLLVIAIGGFAFGQSDDRQRILTADEQARWPAIGLIAYTPDATGAVCTGTLVAPDLLLTAAHCVSRDGVAFAAPDIYFFAAWRDGQALATARGTSVFLAKGAEQKVWSMKSDMALVVLDTPISAGIATPLVLAPDEALSGDADFISYQRDARQFAQITSGCRVIDGAKPVIGLDCKVVTGNSGSPVLQQGVDGWHIAAVVVSDGIGRDGVLAYAMRPSEDIRRRIAQH